jgi:chaperonin GroES
MSVVRIKPIHDRIVLKREAEVMQTKSGLILTSSISDKPSEGVILAVGNGKPLENGEFREMQVKVGDKILFSKFAGSEVKVDDQLYTIITENDVMGIVV